MDGMMNRVCPINYSDVIPFLKRQHYAKRMCSISYCFGAYRDNDLVGIITYGVPASPSLCVGVCGEKWSKNVLELNRLCCEREHNLASQIIGRTLRMLPKPSIVVSYADTGMCHIGYVYQSTNFIYTGLTDFGRKTPRSDRISNTNRHGRHEKNKDVPLTYRTQKHRYIYFVGTKNQIKTLKNDLKYKILDYPKGESKQYEIKKVESQMILFGV